MLQLRGFNDGTPTHSLHAGLYRTDRTILEIGGDQIDLCIVPRRTDHLRGDHRPQAVPSAWYDLIWTPPAARDIPADELHAHGTRVGELPAPPVIPLEKRLAAAPPATLDGLSEAQIRMMGGPEKALDWLEGLRYCAIQSDRTVDIYDWDAYAATTITLIRALPMPTAEAAQ